MFLSYAQIQSIAVIRNCLSQCSFAVQERYRSEVKAPVNASKQDPRGKHKEKQYNENAATKMPNDESTIVLHEHTVIQLFSQAFQAQTILNCQHLAFNEIHFVREAVQCILSNVFI